MPDQILGCVIRAWRSLVWGIKTEAAFLSGRGCIMTDQIDPLGRTAAEQLPEYLESYDYLSQHFRAQLEGLSTTSKGEKFARFVLRVVPQTQIGADFHPPTLSEKKSSDEGVDLTAQGKDGRSVLFIQAKLWTDRAEEVDSVLSKFQAFLTHHYSQNQQVNLFPPDAAPTYFMLVTLSDLTNILKKYESREWASRSFYLQQRRERRLHFVHAKDILSILRAVYRKIHFLPANLVLNMETEIIQKGNVHYGIISSTELRKLYQSFGDALFFENIRDFLGPARGRDRAGRTTPNDEIIKTIKECPEKMLERNNGIVFRADSVTIGETATQLLLNRGSVVNGCQTTMCIVEHADTACHVSVKVVQTEDSWPIAKAANYQNSVADIDLDLARNLRPQLVKRAAALSGVRIDDGEKSAFDVLDEIYDQRVAYDETRLLYIGLFSRTPNNLFSANYTELMQELVERFYREDPYGERTFDVLFTLHLAAQEALQKARETFTHESYADLFQRFYKADSPSYNCFVAILALCGSIDMNVADRRPNGFDEHKRMHDFLSKAFTMLKNDKQRFLRYYMLALKIWMQEVMPTAADEATVRRDMSLQTRTANFNGMFRKLCMEADLHARPL